ncbi:MAG: hypothetical protein AAF208_03855 [Cyanobacteria bacterium P01_A01_bin.45]|mgnify:CR=1 FL=1
MFTIDLTLRNTAFPFSIERESEEDAQTIYKQIIDAIGSQSPEILEIESEGKIKKKIAIRVSEISGFQLTQKEGSGIGSGRQPGFFALNAES